MPPSATTPSAAIRRKRIARSPPLLPVHDDDRKDDFVAKMYFTDDIGGGIELRLELGGEDITMERWNGRRTGLSTEGEGQGKRNHLLHFGAESGSSAIRAFLYFCLRTISSSLIFFLGIACSSLAFLSVLTRGLRAHANRPISGSVIYRADASAIVDSTEKGLRLKSHVHDSPLSWRGKSRCRIPPKLSSYRCTSCNYVEMIYL